MKRFAIVVLILLACGATGCRQWCEPTPPPYYCQPCAPVCCPPTTAPSSCSPCTPTTGSIQPNLSSPPPGSGTTYGSPPAAGAYGAPRTNSGGLGQPSIPSNVPMGPR